VEVVTWRRRSNEVGASLRGKMRGYEHHALTWKPMRFRDQLREAKDALVYEESGNGNRQSPSGKVRTVSCAHLG